MGMEVEGIILGISTNGKRGNDMKLMEVILRDENLDEAIKRVKSNKGVASPSICRYSRKHSILFHPHEITILNYRTVPEFELFEHCVWWVAPYKH